MILNVALGIALVFLCYLVTMGKAKKRQPRLRWLS